MTHSHDRWVVLLWSTLPLLVIAGAAYLDGPPAAHNAGFGNPSCHTCHFDTDVNPPGGHLKLVQPHDWMPGEVTAVRVELSHPVLKKGGFQVSTRWKGSGKQAGNLIPLSDRTTVQELRGIQYLNHTRLGSTPKASGDISWSFEWLVPADSAGLILFHVAANAANGDNSEFGDAIYLIEELLLLE